MFEAFIVVCKVGVAVVLIFRCVEILLQIRS